MTEASEWRGRVGDTWAAEWQRTDRAFAGIAATLDDAIAGVRHRAPADGAVSACRVLDIGSGAGATSLAIAVAHPATHITGIDLSAELVAVAARRAAARGLGERVDFITGDAVAEAAAHGPFDLLVSRHGVMFFADPHAAFAALRAVARPGAPLIFSCFRDRRDNPWAGGAAEAVASSPPPAAGTAPGPFAFADPDHVAAILAAAGWRDAAPHAIDTLFRAGEGDDPVADAIDFLGRIGSAASLLRALPDAERPAARDRLAAFAAAYRHGDAIDFPAAIWIWTATA